MCLTSEAFAMFLSLLAFERIDSEAGRITVNSDDGAVVWTARDDAWCARKPAFAAQAQVDRG